MNRVIRVLCAEADSERLRPVLDALLKKGLRVSDARNAGKNDIILAALSENFYADPEGTDALLGLIGAGAENVLPLQLDGVPVPDTLKNALYARNIIPAAGREPVQIAERIVSALPRKKRRLPLVLEGATRTGIGIGTPYPAFLLPGNPAAAVPITAAMLGIKVAPLEFGNIAALHHLNVNRHFFAAIEVQRPAGIPSDTVIVQVSLGLDFHRASVQGFPIASDACVVPE